MKKTLLFLLSICMIFSSLVFCVSAKEEYEAYEGNLYMKGELMVTSTQFVNPDDYVGEGPFDFFGVSIVGFRIRFSASMLNNEKEAYWIKVAPDVNTAEALEYLLEKEYIVSAFYNWVAYPDEDWGTETCDIENSPFIEKSKEELKAHWRFVPDEFTLCLNAEIDLTEFEGEDKHYLYGILIDEISRVESEESFIYNVKIGVQGAQNDGAFKVFEGNENVLWVEYKTTYGSGDINEDGTVDSSDYLLAKRICFGTYTPTNFEYGCIDMNFDGIVDSVDYLLLKRYCFGTYVPDNSVIGSIM